jgi:outer membrane protein TolC
MNRCCFAFVSRALLSGALVSCLIATATAADPQALTLPEAVRLALAQNRALKIARLKVLENEQKKVAERANYFPEITNHSTAGHLTALQNIVIPTGAFAVFPNIGPVPSHDILIDQGGLNFVTSGTMVSQPITPLIRIHQANRIAASEVVASRDDLKKAENEVALQVHEVYYGILTTRLQRLATEQEIAYSRTRLHESDEDIRNGNALKIAAIESQAGLLESEQALLTLDLRLSDLNSELNDLLGLPLQTVLLLSPIEPAVLNNASREDTLRMALSENPQIHAAEEKVQQAKAALTAAKSAYIPDISVFARHSYQNGAPFLVHNFGTFGVVLNYDIFDFGKRRAVVREREAQLAQAQENEERLKEALGVQIERSLNKVERTKQMLRVAAEVVKLRAEGERVAANQLAQGVVLVSTRRQASAANYKAQADLLQAQLAHYLAQAELEQTIGRTPGQ